jgi:hypothetical protein
MIQPNELRIGTLVLSRLTGKVVVVDWLVIKHIQDNGNFQSAYDTRPVYAPIPLSEEWLKKFGFEDNSYAVFHKNYSNDGCITVSFKDYAHTTLSDFPITAWPNDYSLPIKCIYVHQLQNIWHAITGTELILTVSEPLIGSEGNN